MTELDPRVTPARPDLAAASLRGVVTAERYVEGRPRRVVWPVAPLRRAPASDAPLDTEALLGETVTVYDRTGEGWAWVQLDADGYVGWTPDEALGPIGAAPTHRVAATRTFGYPGPGIKLPPREALPLNSRLSIIRDEGDFAVGACGGWFYRAHLAPIGEWEPDFVAVAERFLWTPYLWGGRSSLGLDCSGLVQLALQAAGADAPRDTDMQERALGRAADPGGPRVRGDLVFWKGHVGIMLDAERLLHANGHHMRVEFEPLAEAAARVEAKGGGGITSIRRQKS